MSTFNGLDLLLLLIAVTCAYGWWATSRLLNLYRAHATKQGEALLMCYPGLQETSQTGDVYDWERDGL